MKRSCYDCKKFEENYRFAEDGSLYCVGLSCRIGTKVTNGDEAQSCFRYEFTPSVRELPDRIKPDELLVQLKTELYYLKNIIAEIEKFYNEKK